MKATYTKETSDFQQARIEALEKFVEMQQNLIDALTFRNDELMFDYAEAKAKVGNYKLKYNFESNSQLNCFWFSANDCWEL